MVVFRKREDISKYLLQKRAAQVEIGFVPTMGALHQGHISLIDKAKENNQLVVCSIFVNPTQFNNSKDFEKYPVTIETDIDMLEKADCDILFLPAVDEIYSTDYKKITQYHLGDLENILEGKYRPGHFQGVCQVVDRLLMIIDPTYLYLGQKDYQQCMVIAKLIQLTGSSTRIIICPTLREPDGLAMSSRNMRLDEIERKKAVKIHETLSFIKQEIKAGYLGDLKLRAANYLQAEGFMVDYVEIADATTLELIEQNYSNKKLVALVAAFINEVRLIDNMVLGDG